MENHGECIVCDLKANATCHFCIDCTKAWLCSQHCLTVLSDVYKGLPVSCCFKCYHKHKNVLKLEDNDKSVLNNYKKSNIDISNHESNVVDARYDYTYKN